MSLKVGCLVVCCACLSFPLQAQRERDESRLSFGLAVGGSTGIGLWRLSHQPLYDRFGVVDTISLSRSLGASVSASLQFTWFPGPNFGVSGEIMMIGGSFTTQCAIRSGARTYNNQTICNSINRGSRTSKAVTVDGGVMYRIRSRSFFSPYASLRGGIAISQSSTLQVEAFPSGNLAGARQLIIFSDPAPRHITPVVMVGIGFTSGVATGYRLRWELRNLTTGMERVDGATAGRHNQEPPHSLEYFQRWGLLFGAEIMLDRNRGTRY